MGGSKERGEQEDKEGMTTLNIFFSSSSPPVGRRRRQAAKDRTDSQ